jgi:hypothetical protein
MYSRIRTATARTTGYLLTGKFGNCNKNVPKLRGEELPRAQQRFQSGVTMVSIFFIQQTALSIFSSRFFLDFLY